MKNNLVKLLTGVFLIVMSQVAYAASPNISTMAKILVHLNHYPSSAEKQILSGIVKNESATAGEKVLAGAIQGMKHQVGADVAKDLRALSENSQASQQERAMADILLGINHKPSTNDKKSLQDMTQ